MSCVDRVCLRKRLAKMALRSASVARALAVGELDELVSRLTEVCLLGRPLTPKRVAWEASAYVRETVRAAGVDVELEGLMYSESQTAIAGLGGPRGAALVERATPAGQYHVVLAREVAEAMVLAGHEVWVLWAMGRLTTFDVVKYLGLSVREAMAVRDRVCAAWSAWAGSYC